jgi:hypothetical protein
MSELGKRLLLLPACWFLIFFHFTVNGQPACYISGGSDEICNGNSTTWSAPEAMESYLWIGPSGYSTINQEITISTAGNYTLFVTDLSGTASCSRTLAIYQQLSPGSINTTLREFCVGGTTAIGGTNSPNGPATGGSGSYSYTWQLQAGCSGGWTDIPGTNTTSYTPAAPLITTCYRRKVTDQICYTETWTDYKRFEIFEDPVSQAIVPQPEIPAVCAGSPVSATFTGGSGGYPSGTADIYEYSTNGGSVWSTYAPEENISTAGLSGNNVVRIRTRRISTGVNGCNYGAYNIVSWSVDPMPNTSVIYHR